MQTGTPPMLIVSNDDTLQLRLAAAGLRQDGLSALTCESPQEALEPLHTGTPVDAIVTDVPIPGIAGWLPCRLLRSVKYTACNHGPMLVLSATFSGVAAAQMARDPSAHAFLPIPYGPMALRTCVRALLAGVTPQAPRRLLIAVANLELTVPLCHTLTSPRSTVAMAGTGDEARRLLHEQRSPLVILDAQWPDMPADQVLTACRGGTQASVAIMLLAHTTPDMHKPVEPAAFLDLCTRALRERGLRASQAQMCLSFESIPDAVYVHAADGTIPAFTAVGTRWCKRPATDLIGQHISVLVTPPDAPSLAFTPPPMPQSTATTCQTVRTARTGQPLVVEVTARPPTLLGQVATLRGIRDISERAAAAPQASKAAAVTAHHSQSAFLANVSHGMRTPMPRHHRHERTHPVDGQMSHRDGLAATWAIRAQEQGTDMPLPLVAVTAHAMQSDCEHCLAAGMDGSVPQPLRPVELCATTARLTAPAASMPAVSPTPAPARTILDRSALWARVDGDTDLLRDLIALFLADCPERLQELHGALVRRDGLALARAAHRFKGTLSNLSAYSATAVIQRLEIAARDGDLASAAAALATLVDELAQLTPLLTAYLEEGQPDLRKA